MVFGLFRQPQRAPAALRNAPRRMHGYDPSRTNGPDTPVLDASRLRIALTHAAFRDPAVQVRRNTELRRGLAVLERTAACVDLVLERLDEAAAAVRQGVQSSSPVMRGLLASRTDELLDSLAQIAALGGEAGANLLDGGSNGLRLRLESGEFSYALAPISLDRGGRGLAIPSCDTAFECPDETARIESALARARGRMAQFAQRLSHDASLVLQLIDAPADAAPAEAAPLPDEALAGAPDPDVTGHEAATAEPARQSA